MELPEDIRRKIEESHDPETIRDVVSRLQSDGVKITDDVLAAIVATIAMTQGIVSTPDQSFMRQWNSCTEAEMLLRIIRGKLKPGTWDAFEKAYRATIASTAPIEGLRGRWLVQDLDDPQFWLVDQFVGDRRGTTRLRKQRGFEEYDYSKAVALLFWTI